MRTESYWLHHQERITHSLEDLQSSHPASFRQRPLPWSVRITNGAAQHMVGSLLWFETFIRLQCIMITSNSSQHVQRISLPTSRPLFLYNPLSPGVDHIPMYVASTTECGETCQGSHPQRKETLPPPASVKGQQFLSWERDPGSPSPFHVCDGLMRVTTAAVSSCVQKSVSTALLPSSCSSIISVSSSQCSPSLDGGRDNTDVPLKAGHSVSSTMEHSQLVLLNTLSSSGCL